MKTFYLNTFATLSFSMALLITMSAAAKDFVVDAPECSTSYGLLYVERGANVGAWQAIGASDPAEFVEAMIAASGCFNVSQSSSSAEYIISPGVLTKKQFDNGKDNFSDQPFMPGSDFAHGSPLDAIKGVNNKLGEANSALARINRAGREGGASGRAELAKLAGEIGNLFGGGKMRYGYLQINRVGSGDLIGRGFGRNNTSGLKYDHWSILSKQKASVKSFNNSDKAKLAGGSLINAYFDLHKDLPSLSFGGSAPASTPVATTGQSKPQGKVSVSGSKGYMILSYDSDRYGNKVGYIDVTEDHPNTMPRAVFSMDEPNLNKVKQILAKFDKWVATSKKNDIRSVQKPLASFTYNIMIGLGLDSIREGKSIHPSPITNKFVFIADAKGKYKLEVNVFSGRCGKGDICSSNGADTGATLSVEEVSDLRSLLNDINSLKAQKSKADLLQ